MAQPAHIRSLYRRLLRELPSTPQTTRTQHQKLSAPSHLQQRIRSTISTSLTSSSATPTVTSSSSSTSTTSSSSPSTHSQIQQAEQFIQYVQAQRTYAMLLERYNPGMGMTEEERVRLSARRVGMNLPVEFGKKEGGGGEKA